MPKEREKANTSFFKSIRFWYLSLSPPFVMTKPTALLSRLKLLILIFSVTLNLFLLFPTYTPHAPKFLVSRTSSSPTTRRHIVFAVASSSGSWTRRKPYLRLWYDSASTRAFAFLDSPAPQDSVDDVPVIVSEDTSRFPYYLHGGLRSAIRVARVVKEIVDRGEADVRWYVFGDDDTVFFVDNLVKTLAKYDHDRYYYVGANSESYMQNAIYGFDMAFGGGGFAISHSLATVLATVFDSCLMRYGWLYGSDSRVYTCVAELGVTLTHEPGFHQVDLRGNLLGMLSSHPLSPLVSLHHLDAIDPIFPNFSNNTEAFKHLFRAVKADPARIMQQIVCYDSTHSLTVSVAWGYAIQIYDHNELLPDILSVQKTFQPWRRIRKGEATQYMFQTRDYLKEACKRPTIFYMASVMSNSHGISSNYTRHDVAHCTRANAIKNLEHITVISQKLELDVEEMKAPRRQCCNIVDSSFSDLMTINIRRCRDDELISMYI